MKTSIFIILLVLSQVSEASYLEYINIRNNTGDKTACGLVNNFYESTTNLYEKAYFYGKKSGCFRKTVEFKSLSRVGKVKYYKKYSEEKAIKVKAALDSNQTPDKDLLDLVGVSEHYPELYERLEKKKIQAYMDRPVIAPDENEGDVHSVSYFVASDYQNMIHRYLENDMPEDAQRLAKEYGQYPWAGDHGIKKMQEEIKIHQAIIDKNRKNKKEGVVEKAAPKKVTAELTTALNELKQTKELVASGDKSEDKQSNDVSKSQVNTEILSAKLEEALINKSSLFILALIAVFALFFYSRRKGKTKH